MKPQFLNEELFTEADTLVKENRLRETVSTPDKYILAKNPSFGKVYKPIWIY